MRENKTLHTILPWVAYFNICFFWGTSTVANKLGSTSMHPLMVGAVRFCVTALLVFLGIFIWKIPFKISRRDWKVLGIGSFLMYFLNTVLLLFAAVRVDASISTIVLCLIPIGLVLVDSLSMRKLCVRKIGIVGMIGGFIGISIASANGLLNGGADFLGILLLLLSVAVWCIGTIFLKNHPVDASFPLQIFVQSAVPAAAFLASSFITGTFRFENLNWGGVLPAVYMGITDSIIGLTSYIYLFKRWPTSVVSTYAYINPVVGLILSYFILHEAINSQKIVGAIVILVSVLLIREEDHIYAWWGRKKAHTSKKI